MASATDNQNEEIDSGLFNISLASSDSDSDADSDSPGDATATAAASSSSSTRKGTAHAGAPRDRTAQTEEQFQAVRRTYRAKVENGEIWKSLPLPLGNNTRKVVSKHEAQELLHAVEELYFYRRYEEGAALVRGMLGGDDGDSGGERERDGGEGKGDGGEVMLPKDARELLLTYGRKCREKMGG